MPIVASLILPICQHEVTILNEDPHYIISYIVYLPNPS
jgi:hypothetical protein